MTLVIFLGPHRGGEGAATAVMSPTLKAGGGVIPGSGRFHSTKGSQDTQEK